MRTAARNIDITEMITNTKDAFASILLRDDGEYIFKKAQSTPQSSPTAVFFTPTFHEPPPSMNLPDALSWTKVMSRSKRRTKQEAKRKKNKAKRVRAAQQPVEEHIEPHDDELYMVSHGPRQAIKSNSGSRERLKLRKSGAGLMLKHWKRVGRAKALARSEREMMTTMLMKATGEEGPSPKPASDVVMRDSGKNGVRDRARRQARRASMTAQCTYHEE